ncbi:metallopeptidase domain-containing protein [Arabiibacter massiliensis]|uniref:hypothetical protein n=1 Tax=Arabiibacter massiliensis TaxID=1870985 RepID=UPI0009BAA780|nr:hypothetical protein [Arabiibacter massiliensis]
MATRAALLATALALAWCLGAGARQALADEAGGACAPTAEQRAEYEADGSWAARASFQDALGNEQADAGLIQQALVRQDVENGADARAVPSNWTSGMGATGPAKVLALRVSFPDKEFESGDTLEALQALVDGDPAPASQAYPYESLRAYYERASYGTLSLAGTAVDYVAQHERGYYTNDVGILFMEALAALDGGIDFADYDGNGDGRIDAVYLHFAGGHEGWGSTWWSNERRYADPQAVYDGKQLWNIVTLHEPSNSEAAARMMIHETGHVLGLPDYYSYASQQGGAPERSGILTFDMMMDNQGDHNGFSKWLLGWIGGDRIVRVVANDGGIVVKRGQLEIARVNLGEEGKEVAIEQALEAFTAQEASESGGIVVVSNEDEGLFSSYYLLQYDCAAGNQSVGFFDGERVWHDLPSGFRLFRVQAALTPDGAEFAHTNAYGRVNDQLIELVDPDMDAPHLIEAGSVPHAAEGFRCMLLAGDAITPASRPSSNFYENAGIGFTGLSFEATNVESARGTVRVAYSSAGRPDVGSFTLTPRPGRGIMNIDAVTLEASSAPMLAFPADPEMQPSLVVDGVGQYASARLSGTVVTASFALAADAVKPGSTCELVFPARMFLVARTAQGDLYSPEIRVPLAPGPVAPIERSGEYAGTESPSARAGVSDVFACEDGEKRFFQTEGPTLRLVTLGKDPLSATVRDVSGAVAPFSDEGSDAPELAVVPLGGTRVFVAVELAGALEAYWIDVGDGSLEAQAPLSAGWLPRFVRVGDVAAMVSPWSGSAQLVSTLQPQGDGTVAMRCGTTRAERLVNVDEDAIAFCGTETAGGGLPAAAARVVPAKAVAERLRALMPEPAAEIPADVGSLDEGLASDVEAALPGYLSLDDARRDGDRILVLASTRIGADGTVEQGNVLAAFDGAGTEVSRTEFHSTRGDALTFSRLSVAPHGSVAASRRSPGSTGPFAEHETVFFDASLREGPHLLTTSKADGAWIEGRWLAVGWGLFAATGGAGAPAEAAADYLRVRYDLTGVLDVAPDEPGPAPEPEPEDGSEPPVGARPQPLATTGDGIALAAPALVAAASFAAALALAPKRRRGRR